MTANLPLIGATPSLVAASLATPGGLDTTAATTYTDVNGLAALKKDPQSPQAISAVAQQVEALFLQMMLKSMRDAGAAQETDSNEMSMYQDMFDKQVALSISQHADLGIAKLLKRQVSGKPAPGGLTMPAPAGVPAGGAGTGSTAAIAHSPSQFIDKVLPTLRKAATALGVSPYGMLAQAALETAWGQRLPRNADGSSSFNLFGIKAGEEWTGARVTADSMEVSNGVATPKRATFRAYASIEESISDFSNLLKSSPRYKDAVAAGGSAKAYIESMGKSGYATDPDYANKLKEILNSDVIQAALAPKTAAL